MAKFIQEYCKASGQKVNIDKFSIIFSANVPTDYRRMIEGVLGIKATENQGTYLGVPSLWGRLNVRL